MTQGQGSGERSGGPERPGDPARSALQGTPREGSGVAPAGGAEAPAEPRPQAVLRGTTVSPGLVLGTVHRKDYDLLRVGAERVPLDQVDDELNRLRRGLDESRRQLVDLRSRLKGRVHENDARILDTHLAYLKDSVFIADVENLILNEQMRLEAAIVKVVADFDRIFRLVENETLRQSAVDLRDVGIRVLRNLERGGGAEDDESAPRDYVLVARQLSIVDMFNLSNEHVKGIATKEGGLTGHAAIFARSMGIPTITGIEDLLEQVEEGDFVILDATEGVLRVNPDELLRAQYVDGAERPDSGEVPGWVWESPVIDGEEVVVQASAGNLPEVEQASSLGLPAVGLYHTELLYLVDPSPPSRDALQRHYAAVLAAMEGRAVTFRLLNVDSGLQVRYMHEAREANPALGRVGVRALLARERVLRRQLQALLLASVDRPLRIAVPFVNDCGELRRLKEILFEERHELRKGGASFQEQVEVGVVIETPAAMLGIRDLALESDFLLVNFDSLQQYLLAVDRDNAELSSLLESPHPFVLRALAKACAVAASAGKELALFGVSVVLPENVPLFFGIGVRRFCVSPSALRGFYEALRGTDAGRAVAAAKAVTKGACPSETRSLIAGYKHGYAPSQGSA